MKVKFGDVGDTATGRAGKIRALFVTGRTIQAHTNRCIDENLWTESELRARAAFACKTEVREALGELMDGIPFAGPTQPRAETGPPVWKQLEFWTKADFIYNFDAYARRGGENIAIANKIAKACQERFGDGPSMLQIVQEAVA